MHKVYQLAGALAACLAFCGCGKPPKRLSVGSQSNTAQAIVGEIVAQHLERRLAHAVDRRLQLGNEAIVYQSLLSGEIAVYPTYTGSIETITLREQPSLDPGVVWERARGEMNRLAQLELFPPLGFENPPTMVVRKDDATDANASTLSQAAAGKIRWKIGMSYELQQRMDFIPGISGYKLPMSQAIRSMDAPELFPALDKGNLSMIAANNTDGHLTLQDYQVLTDDKHAFPPYQACLLTRQDAFSAEPKLRAALAELSGKFTTDLVRKMSAEVDLQHHGAAGVAAEFLRHAGLK